MTDIEARKLRQLEVEVQSLHQALRFASSAWDQCQKELREARRDIQWLRDCLMGDGR